MIKVTTKTGQVIPQSELDRIELDRQVSEAFSYLRETDFYYARKMEIGEDVPADVVIKRVEARKLIRANGG